MFDFRVREMQECGITIASVVFEGHHQAVCFDSMTSINHCVVESITTASSGIELSRSIGADSTKEQTRFR